MTSSMSNEAEKEIDNPQKSYHKMTTMSLQTPNLMTQAFPISCPLDPLKNVPTIPI